MCSICLFFFFSFVYLVFGVLEYFTNKKKKLTTKNALASGVPALSNFQYFIPKSFAVNADKNDRHTRILKKNRATN